METQPTPGFWQKNRLLIKSFFIGFLILALLIPSYFIMLLISERNGRHQDVVQEISNKWSGAQTLAGPYLVIPCILNENVNGNNTAVTKFLYFLPDQLNISGNISIEKRHRSIYEVPVYTANMLIQGKFTNAKTINNITGITAVKWSEAKLCFGLTDLKGISEEVLLKWNDEIHPFDVGLPASDISSRGISTSLQLDSSFSGKENAFSITLVLKGSGNLYAMPLGSNTAMHLESSWPNPAFDGKYLPSGDSINSKGFSADWKISHFNRSFPQVFTGDNTVNGLLQESIFGVNFLQPVDSYAQTTRSIKYAILIIALTFIIYFFMEIILRKNVHLLQYILIGFALVVFYALLLSISEYLAFSQSYSIATGATVFLIAWYTKTIFKKWSAVLLFSVILTSLYLFIYVLIQLQDYALLFGSIGLFLLVAIIMYFSRKINWSSAEV